MKIRPAAFAILILLPACGSPPAPEKPDFVPVVEAGIAHERPCAGDKAWLFPATVPTSGLASENQRTSLNALVRAGLLTSDTATAQADRFTLGPDGGSRTERVSARRYSLTPAGQAAYKSYEAPGFGKVGAFCFGRWDVEVVSSTEPDGSLGQEMTTVTYRRRLQDVPAWAQDPVIRERTRMGGRASGTPSDTALHRIMLVRTDTGWVRAGI
jgi:hypothetical protein